MHKMSFIFLSLLIFFLTKVISKTLALKEKKKSLIGTYQFQRMEVKSLIQDEA